MQEKLLYWLLKGMVGLIGHLENWLETFGPLPAEQQIKLSDLISRLGKMVGKN